MTPSLSRETTDLRSPTLFDPLEARGVDVFEHAAILLRDFKPGEAIFSLLTTWANCMPSALRVSHGIDAVSLIDLAASLSRAHQRTEEQGLRSIFGVCALILQAALQEADGLHLELRPDFALVRRSMVGFHCIGEARFTEVRAELFRIDQRLTESLAPKLTLAKTASYFSWHEGKRLNITANGCTFNIADTPLLRDLVHIAQTTIFTSFMVAGIS